MKTRTLLISALCLLAATISLFVGKYPLTLEGIWSDPVQQSVFFRLRLPRTLVALFGGFALGLAGYVFQTIFHNDLASPDVVGVSSGASVGAAFAILFLGSSAVLVTCSAFLGAVLVLLLTLFLSSLQKNRSKATIVLAGIAVHALAQTALTALKLEADPERELASIEYWLMGSLNDVTLTTLPSLLPVVLLVSALLFALYRHVLVLTLDDTEATLLGARVKGTRWGLLLLATLLVASVISVTGLVSFISLLAAHVAKLLVRRHNRTLFLLSGLAGGILLLFADCLTRLTAAELPVSVFTSILGAPALLILLGRKRQHE